MRGTGRVVGAVEERRTKRKLVVLNDPRGGEKRFNRLERSTGASSIHALARTW